MVGMEAKDEKIEIFNKCIVLIIFNGNIFHVTDKGTLVTKKKKRNDVNHGEIL